MNLTHRRDVSICNDDKEQRTSTLILGSERLKVLGNLPHGYEFRPKTIEDARLLIEWLNSWIESSKKGAQL